MAYGAEVYTSSGLLRLSLTDKITRVLHTRTLPASESSSTTVSGFDASKGFAMAVAVSSGGAGVAHKITTSGETVYWDAVDDPDLQQESELLVIMYE